MKPEQAIQKSIMEYLDIKKIWYRRMNSGVMAGEYKGKKSFVRFGSPGMADIMAIHGDWYSVPIGRTWKPQIVIWLEVKAPKGVQSESQKEFQREVESQGHLYAVVRSIEDVEAVLRSL